MYRFIFLNVKSEFVDILLDWFYHVLVQIWFLYVLSRNLDKY
jgi:hypothetical protein